MSLTNNKTKIQSLLDGINALPAAGGVDLPELTNEGEAVDLVSGKELINSSGKVVTGTNPYSKNETDATVSTQADLIAQIQTALADKTAVSPILQTKTVAPTTSTQNVTPDSGYDGLSKVTVNAMPTSTQATPSISVSSAGLITASATQSAGYVSAGTKSATKQLTVQAAQTITPGTSNKTIASGRYLTGAQTIKGDANLKAENIAEGVSIFGVTGTHSGGGSSGGAEIPTVNVTIVEDIAGDTGAAWAYRHSYIEEGSIKYDIHMPAQGFGTVCNTLLRINELSNMFSVSNITVSSADNTSYMQGFVTGNYAYIFIGTSDTTITITQSYEGGGF